MVELGSGNGSSYPGSLDTNNTSEVNSPNAGKTKARAEVPNDHSAAIVAVQTELGTDPAGSKSNVKTFLQLEHGADGTHGTITANVVWKSGTSFTGTLDHANTVNRTYTFQDASYTVIGVDTTDTLTNKTLTTPTIGSFTNAGHDHADAAGGGNIGDATLGQIAITDATVSGSAASPPDSNTLTKENIVKAWAHVTYSGSTPTLADNFNVSGIVDGGVGLLTLQWNTDFANATYALGAMGQHTGAGDTINVSPVGGGSSLTTADVDLIMEDVANHADDDPLAVSVIAIGDQ